MADQPTTLNWSASFRVARPSHSAGKSLPADKMLLPQSALEQLLGASRTPRPSTTHSFTAFDHSNPYAVADALHEHSHHLETDQQLPRPLMFQLVNPSNGNIVYAGVQEFSSAEGEVGLSPILLEALGIQDSDLRDTPPAEDGAVDLTNGESIRPEHEELRITVKAHQLPLGTFVRLMPLEAGYFSDNWEALLERQLRGGFTTLTKGSTITVRGAKGEEFRLLVDKFEPEGDGICVIDTDLAVDIMPLTEDQAWETRRILLSKAQVAPGTASGSSVGHVIDLWKDADGQVLEGDYVDYELPSWSRGNAIAIELSIFDQREVDLFVSPKSNRQRALPRDSEHVFGDFSSPKDGVKRIVIQPTNAELEGAESLLISVHGFSTPGSGSAETTPSRYTLRARVADAQGSAASVDLTTSQQPAADEEQCKNCLQIIPKRTMMLHENFCLRNNIICPLCGDVFQKRSEEWENHWHCPSHPEAYGSSPQTRAKHDYVQHTQHTCPSCEPSNSFTFPSLPELARHRTTICPEKLILCHFCHLDVPQEGDPLDPASEAETVFSGLTAHERADGARTTDCHLCGAFVRLRDMAAHMTNHELDKASRAPPLVCRDTLCGRTLHGTGPRGQINGGTRMGQGPGNDLGLCSLCFAPLFVNMHDPEGRALRRRIERRYLSQLITGCGKKWCANKWCKTGRMNLELEKLGTGVASVLPLVKPLVEDIEDHGKPMHFCVDEGSQRRRLAAELLAAERVWDAAWCVAALEAEGGDLDKARGWLENWAPARAAGAAVHS